MEFLEKDLEEIIYNAYGENPEELKKRGLHIHGVIKRQLRIGNYGIADLVTIEKCYDHEYSPNRYLDTYPDDDKTFSRNVIPKLRITVYELKKDKIGISAYLQALNYTKGIQRYLDEREFSQDVDYDIVLIGSELDISGAFCFIPSFSYNIEFYTYSYGLNGLKFEEKSGYKLTDENFKL